jgi:hypothetical protein
MIDLIKMLHKILILILEGKKEEKQKEEKREQEKQEEIVTIKIL